MPSPSSSLSTLRPDLAGSLEEYDIEAQQNGFIAQRVLPSINVAKASGTFGKVPIEQLAKLHGSIARASGGAYNRGDWQFTTDTFDCLEYGAEEPVDDREAALYSQYVDAEMISARRARFQVLSAAELRASALVFNASTWTGATLTTAVSNEWDDASNATPIADVVAAKQAVWALTGMWPNAIVLNRTVFNNLRKCDDIKESIASAGAGYPRRLADVTEAQIAACFDLQNVIIAGCGYDANKEGQDATTMTQFWSSEYAMVCLIPSGPDIRQPGIGRTMHYAEDGSQIGGTVESYRDETVRSDIIRVRHDVDEKIIYTECGHLLSNITA